MGRIAKPQKSRKHKKIKDAERYADDNKTFIPKIVVDPKANAPPKNIDDQDVPRSVLELMRWKENPNLMKRRKKKKKTFFHPGFDSQLGANEKGMTVPLKPIPNFRQGKRESEKDFLLRVERQSTEVLQRSAMEDKYTVDLEKSDTEEGGVVNKADTGTKKKAKSTARLKEKKLQKKAKQQKHKLERQEKGGFEHLKDAIEFGEVVQQPPSLSAKPRFASAHESGRKPGKNALLLKDILERNEHAQCAKTVRRVGETVKRKDQSLAQQRIMDQERNKAISMYRQLKNKEIT